MNNVFNAKMILKTYLFIKNISLPLQKLGQYDIYMLYNKSIDVKEKSIKGKRKILLLLFYLTFMYN